MQQPPPNNQPFYYGTPPQMGAYQPGQSWQPMPQQPPKKKSGLAKLLGVGCFAIIVVGVLITIIAMSAGTAAVRSSTASLDTPTPNVSSGKWVVAYSYTGNGVQGTPNITVPDNWKIEYTCKASTIDGYTSSGVLQAYLYGGDNQIQGVAINETCPVGKTTTGTTEEHSGGQVHFDVNATSPWTLKVLVQK